jgi:uncharacterized protein
VNGAGGRRRRRTVRLLVLAVSLAAASARADRYDEQIPEKPARYVTDRASVLGPGVAEALNEKLAQFERDTSNQILVWIDRRLPEGFTLEDFTVRAAQKWGAGQKQTDNGAILFVFPDDRKVRIEVGYGLEGAIPDVTAKRIIDDEVVPRFRGGDFSGGVEAGANALMAAARGEYKGTGRTQAEGRRRTSVVAGCLPWILIFGIFFLLPWLLRRNRNYRTFRGDGWSSGVGGFPIIFPAAPGEAAGPRAGAGGREEDGPGRGGFSGGGGSFGGGGASGAGRNAWLVLALRRRTDRRRDRESGEGALRARFAST